MNRPLQLFAAASVWSLTLLSSPGVASAAPRTDTSDEPNPLDEDSPTRARADTKKDEPKDGDRSAAAPASNSDAAEDTSDTESLGPVERLPNSAYPQWTTRGLYGGSLWLSGNMHGMPWPYYPKNGIGVSGYIWMDSGYEVIKRGNPGEGNTKYLVSQARGVLRVTPTYSKGSWYVQGQAELVGNSDQTRTPSLATIDDLWIRTGEWKQWDVQLGRYEAFEVYHFGMGMDLNTLERNGPTETAGPNGLGVPNTPGIQTFVVRQDGVGNAALHLYPADWLRLELLTQFGFDNASSLDGYSARPAAVFDAGWLKFKVAGEIRKQFPLVGTKSKESRFIRGGSAALQFVFDPYVEFGFNAALELTDHYSPTNPDPSATMGAYDGIGSPTDIAAGGFCNVRVVGDLLLGAGLNYVHEKNQVQDVVTNTQGFGALQYIINKKLFIKVVGGYAKANFTAGSGSPAPFDNVMLSGRARVMYLF
ncbi:MAG: hypothetical protein ABI548_15285 [Polyangiaceae bacterium]